MTRGDLIHPRYDDTHPNAGGCSPCVLCSLPVVGGYGGQMLSLPAPDQHRRIYAHHGCQVLAGILPGIETAIRLAPKPGPVIHG